MTKLEKLSAQVTRARESVEKARSRLEFLEKSYEKLCQETEEQVTQSGKGVSRTLYYQGKSVRVTKQTYSWVIVRQDRSREHYNSLRQIRLGIVAGTIAI